MCATSHQHLLPGQQCLAAPLRTQCQHGTKASPRSGPCYSVARIGLPPACRFHRIGGGPGACSVLTHRATVSSACCCARPRRRMAPRWRPASPFAPSTPGEWTNWRGAAATQPVPSRRFLVHRRRTLYRTLLSSRSQDPACQPSLPASLDRDRRTALLEVGAGWLVGVRWSRESCPLPAIGSDISGHDAASNAGGSRLSAPSLPAPTGKGSHSLVPRLARPSRPSQSQAQERTARNRPPTASHARNRRRVRAVPAATDVAMARRVIWALGRPGQQKKEKKKQTGGES